MYRLAYGPTKRRQGRPRLIFSKYWGKGPHPRKPAVIEIRYQDFLKAPCKVNIYTGSGYTFLGIIPDTNDKKWHHAYFLADEKNIGADADGNMRILFRVPDNNKIAITTVRLMEVTPKSRITAVHFARKYQKRLRYLSTLGFMKQHWGESQKLLIKPDQVDKDTYLVPYQRPFDQWQFEHYKPEHTEVTRELNTHLARGESEPLTLSLFALKAADGLSLEISEFKDGSGNRFPGTIVPGYVEHEIGRAHV